MRFWLPSGFSIFLLFSNSCRFIFLNSAHGSSVREGTDCRVHSCIHGSWIGAHQGNRASLPYFRDTYLETEKTLTIARHFIEKYVFISSPRYSVEIESVAHPTKKFSTVDLSPFILMLLNSCLHRLDDHKFACQTGAPFIGCLDTLWRSRGRLWLSRAHRF